MALELILLEDVENLGRIGDQVKVKEGFARNFLIPRKKAVTVTPAALRQLEARKAKLQAEHAARVAVAQSMADKISKMSVSLSVQAGEGDKLYGSVTSQTIAEALHEQGIEVEKSCVLLDEPLRELGVYTVDISLHEEVQTTLKVWVVRAP